MYIYISYNNISIDTSIATCEFVLEENIVGGRNGGEGGEEGSKRGQRAKMVQLILLQRQ